MTSLHSVLGQDRAQGWEVRVQHRKHPSHGSAWEFVGTPLRSTPESRFRRKMVNQQRLHASLSLIVTPTIRGQVSGGDGGGPNSDRVLPPNANTRESEMVELTLISSAVVCSPRPVFSSRNQWYPRSIVCTRRGSENAQLPGVMRFFLGLTCVSTL